jgi:polysaccharide export outer membrane protein
VILVSLGACGPSAYTDVDLTREMQPGAETELSPAAESFADPGDAAADAAIYRIGAGDVLEVVFFSHPEQNRFVTVRPDGRITLPYVGEIVARGMEPAALSDEIETLYAEVLVDPHVDVLMSQMGGRFYILGEVKLAGEYEYDRPITIMQAVAKAGGYTESARLTNFVLIRDDGEGGRYAAILNMREYMSSQDKYGDIYVQPEDIVWVPKDNISRWDNATGKALEGVLKAQDVIIKTMGIADFQNIYGRGYNRP